jgi:hypothetical protein
LSARYVWGKTPGRNNLVLKVASGARVGVKDGVVVRVAVVLGLGVTVRVGGCVSVGVWLAVLVALGTIVHVRLGSLVACWLHAANIPAINRNQTDK